MSALLHTLVSRPLFAGSGFFQLRAMAEVYRSRRALAQLDASALRDVGISTSQANAETARPLWDIPANWRSCA